LPARRENFGIGTCIGRIELHLEVERIGVEIHRARHRDFGAELDREETAGHGHLGGGRIPGLGPQRDASGGRIKYLEAHVIRAIGHRRAARRRDLALVADDAGDAGGGVDGGDDERPCDALEVEGGEERESKEKLGERLGSCVLCLA